MNNRNLLIGVLAVLVIGGGYFFLMNRPASAPSDGANSTQTTVQSTPTSTQASEATDSAMTEGKVKEFTIESSGLSFTPKELKVKVGDTVKVTYKNNVGTHDFTLDEFNVKTKRIGAGQQETVEFVANKAGTFEFYCSVVGHRLAGMKGNLIVE